MTENKICKKLLKISACSLIILTTSCSGGSLLDIDHHRHNFSRPDIIDNDLQMTRKDFAEGLKADPIQNLEEENVMDIAPLSLSPIISEPPLPNFINDKLISLTITEEIDVKDVLLEIGKLSDINISIGKNVSGGVILRVKDKPLIEVINQIADSANLRYKFEGNLLKVEKDDPYLITYHSDFLNLDRSSTGGSSINTQVIGGSGSDSGGVASGSNNTITTKYDGDIWKSIEASLKDILGLAGSSGSTGGMIDEGNANSARATSFTLNKNAGIISVIANSKQHNDIERYLSHIERTSSAQVLIEAKILEVVLDDEFNTGIDWNFLDKNLNLGINANFNTNFTAATNIFKLHSKALTNFIQIAETFGTTRTLSSPRIHAINNQHAFITFAENKVYFTLAVENEKETSDAGVTTNNLKIESKLNTVPIGVILNLQPSINLDTSEITMNVRPTLSRITDYVEDPAVRITLADAEATAASGDATLDFSTVTSEIPVIEVREMDSVLKIKSGEVMVIGGLMEERVVNTDKGIPYISSIPLIGNAFKSVSRDKRTVETVIFIKASIVANHGVSKQDKRFYKKYGVDPRPLFTN